MKRAIRAFAEGVRRGIQQSELRRDVHTVEVEIANTEAAKAKADAAIADFEATLAGIEAEAAREGFTGDPMVEAALDVYRQKLRATKQRRANNTTSKLGLPSPTTSPST